MDNGGTNILKDFRNAPPANVYLLSKNYILIICGLGLPLLCDNSETTLIQKVTVCQYLP